MHGKVLETTVLYPYGLALLSEPYALQPRLPPLPHPGAVVNHLEKAPLGQVGVDDRLQPVGLAEERRRNGIIRAEPLFHSWFVD